jgi:DNA-binding cell septation regulator SpoVG
MQTEVWRRVESTSSLRGFFTLRLPSGLVIHDLSLHEREGSRWVQLPGKPLIGRDGRQLTTPKTGRLAWDVVVEIPDSKTRAKFQDEALRAIDRLLGEGGAR